MYYSTSKYVTGTVELTTDTSSTSGSTITYRVNAGKRVSFSTSDFLKLYQTEYSGTPRWVEFETSDTLSASSSGLIYSEYGKSREKSFTRTTIDDYKFYYSDSGYGDYALSNLSFVASSSFKGSITLDATIYYSSSRYVTCTVEISSTTSSSTSGQTISWTVSGGRELTFARADFQKLYQTEYSGNPRWVELSTDSAITGGTLYINYGGSREIKLTRTTLDDYKFYYDDSGYGDYALTSLSFVANSGFSNTVTLDVTVYYSSSKYVTGTLKINPVSTVTTSTMSGDIRYSMSYNSKLQINANDFTRFLRRQFASRASFTETVAFTQPLASGAS